MTDFQRRTASRIRVAFAAAGLLGLAACQPSAPTAGLTLNKAQGSSENIASLTQVVRANTRGPQA